METLSFDQIQNNLPLKSKTPEAWTSCVLENLNAFLTDHASCERKAHAAAMMLVNRYPEHPGLQDTMITLAREELEHFQSVFSLLRARNLPLPSDEVDPYVKDLLKLARHPRDQNLLDRLIIVAIIEARSCERFCLLANALPDSELRDFYREFATAEGRHFQLFVNEAKKLFPENIVEERLQQLLVTEANIIEKLPIKPTVH